MKIMSIKRLTVVLAFSLMLPGHFIFAEEQVYGWQLMTEQERNEHRSKMQNMSTEEERERYRLEHHNKMQQRAKKQGKTLPDMMQRNNNRMGNMPGRGGGGRR